MDNGESGDWNEGHIFKFTIFSTADDFTIDDNLKY